ncbi:unnamed protein product [Didymodactylos carnosus]|uniref:Uncharacterized protein n=2 Tax=Didymodactylos carnosus TaxID=1234261 RepID=A0A8S2G928_9BILA|nr:unnamed protein product [Didymodactylos carnosus]CAF4516591.1 unnamed protein product [Didymodactylos carnosus]
MLVEPYALPHPPAWNPVNALKRFGRVITAPFTTSSKSMSGTSKPLDMTLRRDLAVFFGKIYDQLLSLIIDNGMIRPVEIDLIQKIVGLTNTIIDDVNRELAVFDLSLSKIVSSTIHSNVLIVLNVCHFFVKFSAEFEDTAAI